MSGATAPLVTALARKWRVDIDTNNSEISPTWVQVKGISTLKWDPNQASLEDDDAYDQNGRLSKTKTALYDMAEIKLLRRHRPADPTDYDAGQEALRSRSSQFGEDGWAHCRIYDRFGGPEAYEGWFEVSWGGDGGGTKDLEAVTVTLDSKGQTVTIVNPDAVSGS